LRYPGRPLAVARILIGASALFNGAESLQQLVLLALPGIVLDPMLGVLPYAGKPGFLLAGLIWLLACLVIVNYRVRFSAGALSLVLWYLLLLDANLYSNHRWLLALLTGLLSFTGGGRYRQTPSASNDEEYWPVFLMKAQLSILYAATAIAKLNNPTWMSGVVFRQDVVGGNLFPGLDPLLAAATVAFELAVAAGLWLEKSRKLSVIAAILFHVSIVALIPRFWLDHTAFSLEMVAVLILFWQPPRPARASALVYKTDGNRESLSAL
jgi:hypothetical protein